jgi:hypothetical protein
VNDLQNSGGKGGGRAVRGSIFSDSVLDKAKLACHRKLDTPRRRMLCEGHRGVRHDGKLSR